MENLIYSFNSVVPLFVLVVIGYLLRRKNVIQDSFVSTGTKIGFQVALPVLLFQQVSQADLTTVFNPRLILFAVASILLTVLLLTAVIPLFVKGNPQRGAMIQGIYRGNFAILGVPLAINMFGETGAAPTSLLLPFTIPLYNILAVVILVLFEPKDGPKNQVDMGKILKGILTNPLIIGILLALPFAIFKIQLPEMVDRSLDSISSLTTPLALICLGGQFQFQSAKENLGLTLTATLLKQIFLPARGAVRGGMDGLSPGRAGGRLYPVHGAQRGLQLYYGQKYALGRPAGGADPDDDHSGVPFYHLPRHLPAPLHGPSVSDTPFPKRAGVPPFSGRDAAFLLWKRMRNPAAVNGEKTKAYQRETKDSRENSGWVKRKCKKSNF